MEEIDYCNPPIYNKEGVEISSPDENQRLKFNIFKLANYYFHHSEENYKNNRKHELKQQHKPIRNYLENHNDQDYTNLLDAMLFTFQDELSNEDALLEIGEFFINCEIKAIQDTIEINKTITKNK